MRDLIVIAARVALVVAVGATAFVAWEHMRDAGSDKSCAHYVQQNSGDQQQELDRYLAQHPTGAPSAPVSFGDFIGDGHSLLCAVRSGSGGTLPSGSGLNPLPAQPH
ncbi:hypothetical protein [Nocardia stercoris]|uniref:hypothetical protein n=1 Tax=Nocardia stercoris TaxID=2483361 RepID=UPI0011C386DE|nr:hypothetical protein [Nocardia stercoris]